MVYFSISPEPRRAPEGGYINWMLTGKGKGVDVLAVICASHVLLSKTDSVFPLGDTVEDFKVLL